MDLYLNLDIQISHLLNSGVGLGLAFKGLDNQPKRYPEQEIQQRMPELGGAPSEQSDYYARQRQSNRYQAGMVVPVCSFFYVQQIFLDLKPHVLTLP